MSQQDNKPFQWDDRKVKHLLAEYWNIPVADLSKFIDRQIEHFKESHSPIHSSEKVDWEVIKLEHKGAISFLSTGRGYTLEEIQKDGWSIYSVRRLSDNSVWTVNDKNHDGLIITHFEIKDGEMYAHFAPHADHDKPLSALKKAPKPEEKPTAKPPIDNIDQLVEMEKVFNAAREMNASIDVALGAPFLKYKSFMEYHKIKEGEGI